MIRYAFASLLAILSLATFAGCSSSVENGTGGSGGAPPATKYTDCDGPGQCVLVMKGCCGVCGTPEAKDLAPINKALAGAFQDSVNCPTFPVEGCPTCAPLPNPHLFAYCDSGTCKIGDTRTHEVGTCTTAADCTLRDGTNCCEGCATSEENLTAVNKTGAMEALACVPGQSCDACAPQYPSTAGVECVQGHCGVVLAGGN